MEILRFTTAGSVDDGKSTLIGRLLHDTGNIKSDILETIDGESGLNLAYITDGLRSERNEGITIDIGYKYFSTASRRYIIADAPGHFQYTRNLVTGASNVDVMIILIDALVGITSQTRIHSLVASFLGINHVVVAVNKMDKVGFDELVFTRLKNEYMQIATGLNLKCIDFIPVSALHGDNVITYSINMPWYKGKTVLQYLEETPTDDKSNSDFLRVSVQYVFDTPNAFAGNIVSGSIKKGDVVKLYPEGANVTVSKIIKGYDEVSEGCKGDNISIYVDGDIAFNRGDLVIDIKHIPSASNAISANVCWLDAINQLAIGKKYLFRLNAFEVEGTITEIVSKLDTNTFAKIIDDKTAAVNDFAVVKMIADAPMLYDTLEVVPLMARGIIIDMDSYYTAGVFIIA